MEEILTAEQVSAQQTKCSACGANMSFDIASGNLKCRHCGNEAEFEDTERVARRQITDDLISNHAKWDEARVMQCGNCGAKEVANSNQLATKCAFCGSAKISAIDELPGIQPDSVIPFAITDETARQQFGKWMKSRWFAPNSFKKSQVREHMNAVYTPVWSFSAQTQNQT